MEISKSEAIRYLGYGKNHPDQRTLELIDECIKEVTESMELRSAKVRLPLTLEGRQISVPGLTMESEALEKNLTGCSEVLFFAATLGREVDRRLERYVKLQISKAAVFQAVAAAAIEDYCNECQEVIREELKGEGLFLRPRFSPGYGDLALTVQPDFLRILSAEKTVGIILSAGGIMLPEKSVTAIMGISPIETNCHTLGCEICGNSECSFRRNA